MFAAMKTIAMGAAMAVASTTGAIADEYPTKPVSMIVAYSPGGGTDTAARILANYMDKHLGQRLIIRNKPGAGGRWVFQLYRVPKMTATQLVSSTYRRFFW